MYNFNVKKAFYSKKKTVNPYKISISIKKTPLNYSIII